MGQIALKTFLLLLPFVTSMSLAKERCHPNHKEFCAVDMKQGQCELNIVYDDPNELGHHGEWALSDWEYNFELKPFRAEDPNGNWLDGLMVLRQNHKMEGNVINDSVPSYSAMASIFYLEGRPFLRFIWQTSFDLTHYSGDQPIFFKTIFNAAMDDGPYTNFEFFTSEEESKHFPFHPVTKSHEDGKVRFEFVPLSNYQVLEELNQDIPVQDEWARHNGNFADSTRHTVLIKCAID